MRLFAAIELPSELKEQLVALKTNVPGASWVKAPAMHLTLKFLGDEIEPIRRTPIKTALASIHMEPFSLRLRGVGRFPPGAKRPARVLWVGIAPQPALIALQAQVEHALAEVDFPPEDRAYSPHITLARLKGEERSPQLDRFLEQYGNFSAEPFTVSEFYLVSSLLKPDGPLYRHEASLPLREPSA